MEISGTPSFGSVNSNQTISNNSTKNSNNVNYFDSHNPLASLAYMHARNNSFPDDNVGKKLNFMS